MSRAASIGLSLALAWLAVVSYRHAEVSFWFFGSLSLCSAVAGVMRFGYVVPLLVAGILCGIIADARPKGGTHESQMWETVGTIAVWAAIGLTTGMILDFRQDRLRSRLRELRSPAVT